MQLLGNHTPQVTAAKRPTAGTPENNNVTAANCDNPRASTPTSSLDNSKSSALSQLLADHTPKVTPIAAAKRPKARLLTSADCLRMLEEKEAKKKKEAEEKEQRRKDREEKRNTEKKKQKEKLKKKQRKQQRELKKRLKKKYRRQQESQGNQEVQIRSRKRQVSETVNEGTADRTEVTNNKNDTEVVSDTRISALLNESIDSNVRMLYVLRKL